MDEFIPVTFDLDKPRKIPTIWRKTLIEIVEDFKSNDLEEINKIEFLKPISAEYANELAENIKNYGENLISLPTETWETSECLWKRTCWDVFIDLYTEQEGRSDLILDVTIFEDGDKFSFQINNIYVP